MVGAGWLEWNDWSRMVGADGLSRLIGTVWFVHDDKGKGRSRMVAAAM
jgi:hypothetical protein